MLPRGPQTNFDRHLGMKKAKLVFCPLPSLCKITYYSESASLHLVPQLEQIQSDYSRVSHFFKGTWLVKKLYVHQGLPLVTAWKLDLCRACSIERLPLGVTAWHNDSMEAGCAGLTTLKSCL
eukprot:80828-Pelagomonas_calceolata.AAC.4